MKNTDDHCPACEGGEIISPNYYRLCKRCGHEFALAHNQGTLVNERLDVHHMKKTDSLDRFKLRTVARAALRRDLIVDIGSGSGKFLLHAKDLFEKHLGVEITQECVRFSENVLGLRVVTDIDLLREPPSVVTLWHSLEHLPSSTAEAILNRIAMLATMETRIIISVPNARSWQARLFGTRNCYYDPRHHLHQFTLESLDYLMVRHGFLRVDTISGFTYCAFGWVQSILNAGLPLAYHNYTYRRLRRGEDFGLPRHHRILLDAIETTAAMCIALPGSLAAILERILTGQGGVITAVYAPGERR